MIAAMREYDPGTSMRLCSYRRSSRTAVLLHFVPFSFRPCTLALSMP
jgi:hypothetical protein